MDLLGKKNRHVGTASNMIERFRKAPPTSRAIREAMKVNGDAPTRMWYEKECEKPATLHDERETEHEKSTLKRRQHADSKKMEDQIDKNGTTWKDRFRNGL